MGVGAAPFSHKLNRSILRVLDSQEVFLSERKNTARITLALRFHQQIARGSL